MSTISCKTRVLKKNLLKKHIFDKVVVFMYTVEFHKRGLPQTHLQIMLDEKYKILTPEAYDRFICTELPNPKANPHLYQLVI